MSVQDDGMTDKNHSITATPNFAAAMTTAIQNVEWLESEIARLRLTAEEREAIEASAHGENDATVIATLRKLLERTK